MAVRKSLSIRNKAEQEFPNQSRTSNPISVVFLLNLKY